MITSEYQANTTTKLERIAWLSSLDKDKRFNNLMHLFNEDALQICYRELNANKTTGVDGVNKIQYGSKLKENIQQLVNKLKAMAYKRHFRIRKKHE